jgi:phytoene dehydrogenase-like protein
VIVVGAGLAGLTAGATAAAGGARTVVLEGRRPGGRCRTSSKGPYTFNMGPHAFYLGGPGAPILRRLGVEPDGVPSPFPCYRLWKHGRHHPVPHGPASLLRTTVMGPAAKAQFARMLGALALTKASRLAGVSVREWLGEHRLNEDAAAVVASLIRLSTYNADMDDFSADAALRQLQIGARPGVLYLHGGWAQLIDGLATRVEVRAGHAVSRVEDTGEGVEVYVGDERFTARQVIVAAGPPDAVRAVLPADPGWGDLGSPVTGACLDLGVTRVPSPGYLLDLDQPLMGVTQSPPARQSPEGHAVVTAIRYGATDADSDRRALFGHVARLGVSESDIAARRFLARMVVAGASPRPGNGGLEGRPAVTASGQRGVLVAGDWVGPEGLLADAAIGSGHSAALHALRSLEHAPVVAV